MSARIAPEPITVGVSLHAEYKREGSSTSRPIESNSPTTPDPRQKSYRTLSDGSKARPGDRPPGKDPSVLPQSLFDAALISAEYKPKIKIEPNPVSEPREAEAQSADINVTQNRIAEQPPAPRDSKSDSAQENDTEKADQTASARTVSA